MPQQVIVAPGLQTTFADFRLMKASSSAPDPIGFSPVRFHGGRSAPPPSSSSKGGDAGSTSTASTERDEDEDGNDGFPQGGKSGATRPVVKVGNCHVTCLTPPELVPATSADSFDFSVVGWGSDGYSSGRGSATYGIGGPRVNDDPVPPVPSTEKYQAPVAEFLLPWITPKQRTSPGKGQQQQMLPCMSSQKRQGPKRRPDSHFLRKIIEEVLDSPPPPTLPRSRPAEVAVSPLAMASPINSLGDETSTIPINSEAPTARPSSPFDAPLVQAPTSVKQGRRRSEANSTPASSAAASSLLTASRRLSRSASNLVMAGTTAPIKPSHAAAATKRCGPSSVQDMNKDARPRKDSAGRGRGRSLVKELKAVSVLPTSTGELEVAHIHRHHTRSCSLGRFQAKRQDPEGIAARDKEAYPSTPQRQRQQRSWSFRLASGIPGLGSPDSTSECPALKGAATLLSPGCFGDPLIVVPPPPPSLQRTGSQAAREVGLTDEQLRRLREAGFYITPRECS